MGRQALDGSQLTVKYGLQTPLRALGKDLLECILRKGKLRSGVRRGHGR